MSITWRVVPQSEVEAPPDPAKTVPDEETAPAEDDDLGEHVRRIIREIPDPTPQPGGE
ncbi:MAG: hypothetical protein OXG43_08975 [Chloroflexi bacterium]|nr:hypothetical protein [Chloroflexota bacterium]